MLLGFGRVGRELARQVARYGDRAPSSLPRVTIVGVVDTSGAVLDGAGIAPAALRSLAGAKARGVPLSAASGGTRASPLRSVELAGALSLARPVLVDATGDDTTAILSTAATRFGMDLVLANKRPLADDGATARELVRTAERNGRRVRHEATVGAGLPVIDTIRKLAETGDPVRRVTGCPSGTLGFVFGELGRGVPFSRAVRTAMDLGYTEPDPRDDLSGRDVARKALILGHLIGFRGALADVRVTSLVPPRWRALPLSEFLSQLPRLDARWESRVAEARVLGRVLRYRATVSRRAVRVGVVQVCATTPLGALTGTDNQFSLVTRRYRDQPLVISGPGAGAGVTAAGVLSDIIQLASSR